MAIIVPYDKNIVNSDGGFITPNGEFVCSGLSCHEGIAQDICCGDDYDSIRNFKFRYDTDSLYYPGEAEEVLKRYGVDSVDVLDDFASSELSAEDLEKYRKWFELVVYGDKWEVYSSEMNSIFLNRFLRYDKLETIRRRTITTTTPFKHTRFFEWLLMGWDIKTVCYFYFDENGEVQVEDPARDKYPGWIKDFNEDQENRETLKRIEKEEWPYQKKLEYIKNRRGK